MRKEEIEIILQQVRNGKLEVDEALRELKSLPYEDLGFAKLDTHRDLRRGFPEVIFCRGKTKEQIKKIIARLHSRKAFIMATKVEPDIYGVIKKVAGAAVYYQTAGIVLIGKRKKSENKNKILVVSAGTADLPVAEEAAVTAEVMGNKVERLYDIGVAGIHRLLDNREKLFNANVIVVVAGMEGALASVVGGLVSKPVIAVPTSVGYGASFEGLAALLTMLNCCAPGVAVMNIDNGFGAGYFASVVNHLGGGK